MAVYLYEQFGSLRLEFETCSIVKIFEKEIESHALERLIIRL